MSDLIKGQSIGERDEQAEEQWHRVNDKDWLLAEKRGYKNKDEYLKAKIRIERIENLIKLGASRAQAIKEVNHQELIETHQIELEEKMRQEERKKKHDEFLARYLGNFNDLMR